MRLVSRHLVARFEGLLLQLLRRRVNRRKQIRGRPDAYQLVVIVMDRGFRLMQMALLREHHVRFAFPLAVQQFADFDEMRLQLWRAAPAPIPPACPCM